MGMVGRQRQRWKYKETETDKMCCSGHSPVILGVQRAHSAVRSNAGVARRVENVARAFCGNNSDD